MDTTISPIGIAGGALILMSILAFVLERLFAAYYEWEKLSLNELTKPQRATRTLLKLLPSAKLPILSGIGHDLRNFWRNSGNRGAFWVSAIFFLVSTFLTIYMFLLSWK